MAQNQNSTVDFNFVNANKTQGNVGNLADIVDYTSVSTLRSTLAAYDAFTYTATQLDIMSVNDMVFAVRNIQDPTTIASYMSAQVARTS